MDKLENVIEAILFLSGNFVDIKDIAAKLNVPAKEIESAAKKLKDKYSGSSGIHILIFNNKLQFSSNPDYAEMVETVLNPIKERELSKAMMEVAAIIAYKQPITRLEIEEIRGVNSDYAVTTLSKHNIIEIVGRKDAIGKPLLYGTTDEFLKRFQLSSLSDLPDYDELIDRIKILHTPDNKDLYYREQYNEKQQENQEGMSAEPKKSEKTENPTNIEIDKRQLVSELSFKNDESLEREACATLDPKIVDGQNSNQQSNQSKGSDMQTYGLMPDEEELPDFLRDEKNIKVIR